MLRVIQRSLLDCAAPGHVIAGLMVLVCTWEQLHDVGQTQISVMEGKLALRFVQCFENTIQHLA